MCVCVCGGGGEDRIRQKMGNVGESDSDIRCLGIGYRKHMDMHPCVTRCVCLSSIASYQYCVERGGVGVSRRAVFIKEV